MIKIYADGANIAQMVEADKNPIIAGFTTNPTLMRQAGVKNYMKFAKEVLKLIKKPVSFEVFSDDFDEMYVQARIISKWADNVYVKIPITNTKGEPSKELIANLVKDKVKVNVTAIMVESQIIETLAVLDEEVPSIISVFAGRISDTGINPKKVMMDAKLIIGEKSELLWASPRQVRDIYTAHECECDIITVTPDLIAKLPLRGKNLNEYSLETVQMFYNDGKGYDIS